MKRKFSAFFAHSRSLVISLPSFCCNEKMIIKYKLVTYKWAWMDIWFEFSTYEQQQQQQKEHKIIK